MKLPFNKTVLLAGLVAAAPVTQAQAILEEVLVTAQRKAESLQDAPIAITAFQAEDIAARGIRDVQDISNFVPNINIAPSPGGDTGATIAIRGSTTINPALTWEPTVGLYLDGVFLGKNLGGIFEVAELERVEVLRGPQGTLYGKNTLGGAVNLVTRMPGEDFGGYLEGGFGNEGYKALRGRIDTGASDVVGEGLGEFRASIAYSTQSRDGFYDNVDLDPTGGFNPFVSPRSNSTFSDMDSDAFRLDAVIQATDTLSYRFSFDQSDVSKAPSMGQLTDVNEAFFAGLGLGFLADLQALYETPSNRRASAISNDQSGFEKSEVRGTSLTVTKEFESMTFKSITSQRDLDWSDRLDIDGTPMNLFTSERQIDYEQFSQEFQWLGQTDSSNWVAGLYYFAEEGDVFNPISFFGLFGAPADNNEYGLDNTSWAVYGQYEWQMSDRLTTTVGLRYTDEEKDQYVFHPQASTGGVGAFDVSDSDSWSNTTGTLVATYALSDNVNVYAKLAQGWKAGGYNGEAPSADAFFESYDPEEVLSQELGFKSRLMDDRVQLNAAVFMNDVSDMQFSVFLEGTGGAASTVDNAGAATIRGVEIELIAQLSESLRLGANLGTLDTQYDEFIELGQNVKDAKDFPYAPDRTMSIDLDWAVMESDWGSIDAHIDWSRKSDYVAYTNPDQNATGQLGSYSILNARVSLSDVKLSDSARLQVSAWGKNITDEEYRENIIPFGLWTISYWGQPATYGVDLRVDF
jgi:iron complex outermembrane receptor protein